MTLPEWMQQNIDAERSSVEMARFNGDPANRISYTPEEWQAKLDVEMSAAGCQKTDSGWTASS